MDISFFITCFSTQCLHLSCILTPHSSLSALLSYSAHFPILLKTILKLTLIFSSHTLKPSPFILNRWNLASYLKKKIKVLQAWISATFLPPCVSACPRTTSPPCSPLSGGSHVTEHPSCLTEQVSVTAQVSSSPQTWSINYSTCVSPGSPLNVYIIHVSPIIKK